MKSSLLLIALVVSLMIISGCTSDPLILKKICSKNGTYCEDVMKTKGISGVAWENLTTVLDSRSADNQTYWENLT
jgi:hypothetical protein